MEESAFLSRARDAFSRQVPPVHHDAQIYIFLLILKRKCIIFHEWINVSEKSFVVLGIGWCLPGGYGRSNPWDVDEIILSIETSV